MGIARLLLWSVLVGAAAAAPGSLARAAEAGIRIESVAIEGNDRTRDTTIVELLPRRMPALYTREELVELERRLNNLEIFDRVTVEHEGTELRITVREKWTLIPEVDFSSGETFEDARFLVGATEYNFLGTANQLRLSAFREERGFGAAVEYDEHPFRRRWSFVSGLVAASASYRFENGSSWNSLRSEGVAGFTSPPVLSDNVNVQLGAYYGYEATSDRVLTNVPARAHSAGTLVTLFYNRYEFHDLAPSGVKVEVKTGAGALASAAPLQPRVDAEVELIAALPLAKYTVFMTRVASGVATRGNANFSFLIGSIKGVRGLDDTLYRPWTYGFANLELRQAIPIAERWALQGVLFTDGAGFERITENGGRGEGALAASAGVGVRVVPTWLARIVVRGDVSYLFAPERRPYFQFGLAQYF